MSGSVVVRAFREEEIESVLDRLPGLEFGPQDLERAREHRRERLRHSGARYEAEILLAIEAEGRLVGEVQARHHPMMAPPGVYDVGIELWDAADRGRGYGRGALEALARFLFEEEHAERVQGSTDLDNAPMRATFASAGFTEEGVLRWFMPSPEGRRDYVQYAITRPEWERR
ncbi:MAG: GNAT family N-acetyltransferase [Actinomycetota bacterium]